VIVSLSLSVLFLSIFIFPRGPRFPTNHGCLHRESFIFPSAAERKLLRALCECDFCINLSAGILAAGCKGLDWMRKLGIWWSRAANKGWRQGKHTLGGRGNKEGFLILYCGERREWAAVEINWLALSRNVLRFHGDKSSAKWERILQNFKAQTDSAILCVQIMLTWQLFETFMFCKYFHPRRFSWL